MSASAGPNIVEDGLVLHLDAADPKSYPNSGDVWYDRSGNGNNFTLINNPIFNSDNRGNISFDGTNQWCETPNLGLSNHTKEVWFRSDDDTQGPGNDGIDIITILGPYISAGGLSGKYTYIGIFNTNLTFRIDDGVSSHQNIHTQDYVAGRWYYAVVTYDASSGVGKAYLDGVFVGSINFVTNLVFDSEKEFIAKSDNEQNESFIGSVAIVKMYNRALSPEEVLQNYNATKSRFGL